MKNNKFNAVPVSKQFEGGGAEARLCNGPTPSKEGRGLRSSPGEWSGQAGRSTSFAFAQDRAAPVQRNGSEEKRQQGCPSTTLRVNRAPQLDAGALWKQIEDVVVPQLGLSVIDHVVYIHLVRHSLLEGKRRLHFSIPWLARNIRLSVCPTREAVRRLAAHGALRLIERSKAGHVAEVRLPEEIRGVRAKTMEARNGTQPTSVIEIEDVDFLKSPELRRTIHEREGGRCFYCLRRITPRMECLDHVVPRAKVRCNSYRNLVSACMECNSQKGERSAEEYLRWLFREHRLGAAELKDRFRKLELLAAGKLRPEIKN